MYPKSERLKRSRFGIYFILFVVQVTISTQIIAQTVMFQEGVNGYSGTVDTHIREVAPGSSHGSLESLEWDGVEGGSNSEKFALIRFENIFGSGIGQIPLDATIISAALEYVVWNTGNSADVNEVSIQWTENATYNNFGGEVGVQPDDYGTSLGSASGSSIGSHSINVTTSLAAWSADPSLNNGWIFRPTGTDGVDARSSEYGTTNQRPKLTVQYSTSNQVPDQPSLISPSDMAIDVEFSPTLTVSVSDPDLDNLTVTFYGRIKAAPDFTLIGLPDTQYYSSSLNGGSPAIFNDQTQWIVANKDALNIVYVPHLGDCVQNGDNNGNPVEWDNADFAISFLEDPLTTMLPDGIPYGIAVGNHDQSPIGNPDGTTAFYNQYFGESRFLGRSYYGGHFGSNNDNSYEFFSAGGLDFIAIYFEFDPSPDADVLNWADNLLQTYSDRLGIIVSHYLIEIGNPGSFGTQGQATYDALKDNPNLFLMLCGHIHGEGRRTDIYNGNIVHTVLSDYQSRTNGGDGWLRIMNFSPGNNEISFQTYSPTLDQFETDGDSQFSLNYDFPGDDFQIIGVNSGVTSGSSTSVAWSNLDALTDYEWYVEINDGNTTIAGPVWSFTTQEDDDPLPVTLSLFTAEAGDETVTLHWTTQSEINNLGFIVERSFHSNGPFQEISSYEYLDELEGQGNSNLLTEYSYTDNNLQNGVTYFYRLADVNLNGEKTYHSSISGKPQKQVINYALYPNFPNPFNQGTMISFEIPILIGEENRVDLTIYNSLGEVVRRLVEKPIAGGVHRIYWSGDNEQGQFVSSGVYFLRLKSNTFIRTQKMVLLR